MNKIEYRDNEDYPRYNGTLMTPEECIKLYGFDGEFDILKKDIISLDGIIYTNKKLYDVIKLLGTIFNACEDEIIQQVEETLVIYIRNIEHLESIKPLEDFKKDHPNINIEKYKEFYGCLNEYYAENYNVTYSNYD